MRKNRSVGDLLDEDQQAVHRLFELIDRFTKQLAPDMQVIITDHADLEEPWFQAAVVERWRGEIKLVPTSWHSSGSASHDDESAPLGSDENDVLVVAFAI